MAGFPLKDAVRRLLRKPLGTIAALLTLALGIGANTAIFSLLNAVVLRPLPIPHPEQLIALSTTIADNVNGDEPFSLRMLDELSRQQQVFSTMFAWFRVGITNFEAAGAHHVAELAAVSGSYYEAMRIAPRLGRFISRSDVVLKSGNTPRLAVLSYRAWRAWYDSDPAIIGKKIRVENEPFTIVGVEPQGYSGLVIDGSADITIPLLSLAQSGFDFRDPRLLWLRLYGRLQPGISGVQAQASLDALWPRILAATTPPGYEGRRLARFNARRIHISSAASGISSLRKRFSASLFVLQILVGAVLLLACLNLTNLSLAAAAGAQRESAIRAALGASTWDLIRQPLVESCLLSFTGAALGLAVAYASSRALLHIAWTGLVETPLDTSPDWRVLTFTAAIAAVTGLLIAVAPAWHSARMPPAAALKRNARSIGGESAIAGKGLLVAQLALALVLSMAALLFGRTLSQIRHVDAGYKRDHLLTMRLLPQSIGSDAQTSAAYWQELSAKLRLPGVAGVSFSVGAPASEEEYLSLVSNSPAQPPAHAIVDFVAPDFFAVAGMRVLGGREFTWQDDQHNEKVAILSQSLAERLFPHADALGQAVYYGPAVHAEKLTVVGVVNSASLWKIESHSPLALYGPLPEKYQDVSQVLVDIRTTVDPHSLKAPAERAVRSLGRHASLRTDTVDERLDSSVSVQRLTALVATSFGVIALIIAAIGVYGLMAFHVTRRTAELGIRAALGAQRQQLLALVLKDVLWLTALGCIVGLAASLWTGKLVANLLFATSPADPFLLGLAALILSCTSVLAGFEPARRAAKMDPMNALRSE